MSTESIALLVVLSVLGLGALYAFKGSLVSDQWRSWITRASLAAGGVLAIGMLTLGLPGAVFLELLGLKLPPDSAWPLAIVISQVGALIIVPASLVLRLLWPHVVGWHHVLLAMLLSVIATFLFTAFIAGRAVH
jgi:hypothetical protein